MPNPETSVVIRTFNEEKHLPTLLEAFRSQCYRDFELIVVDSGSFDRTRKIAQRYCDQVLGISSRDFTFGYSLNVGIGAGAGRFIVIVSAHTKPLDDFWLENLIRPLRDSNTAMVYGRQVGAEVSKFGEMLDFARAFGPKRRVLRPPHFFANNANSAIRKSLWEQHAFNESLPGLEDIEWSKYWMEKGCQVVYEPTAVVYHIHDESWRQVRWRYYREGVAANWIGIKGRRHVPMEVLRETKYLVGDAAHAVRDQEINLWRRIPEIVLFRINKTYGTTRGLMDGAVMTKPAKREALFFDRTCRAVVIRGPGRAALEEIEIPRVRPGDVLIKVAYEGVCATDLEILEGTLGYYKNKVAHYPIVPGHEFSGRVVRLGQNVNGLREGDAVVVECIQSCGHCEACAAGNWIGCAERKEVGVIGQDGGYAEYVAVPGRFVHKFPEQIDLKRACMCEPLAVVLKGLRRLERSWGNAAEKKNCAVVGAGPIGHLCAQVLSLRGHYVTVFDRDPRRRAYFDKMPIDTDTSENMERLGEFEILIEATGVPDALEAMLNHSAAGSVLLLLGLPYARREFNFESIVAYEKTIIGSVGSSSADFEAAINILPGLELGAFTEKVLPLVQYAEAWKISDERRYLKVILQVDRLADQDLVQTETS